MIDLSNIKPLINTNLQPDYSLGDHVELLYRAQQLALQNEHLKQQSIQNVADLFYNTTKLQQEKSIAQMQHQHAMGMLQEMARHNQVEESLTGVQRGIEAGELELREKEFGAQQPVINALTGETKLLPGGLKAPLLMNQNLIDKKLEILSSYANISGIELQLMNNFDIVEKNVSGRVGGIGQAFKTMAGLEDPQFNAALNNLNTTMIQYGRAGGILSGRPSNLQTQIDLKQAANMFSTKNETENLKNMLLLSIAFNKNARRIIAQKLGITRDELDNIDKNQQSVMDQQKRINSVNNYENFKQNRGIK